ncbi:hypothetical protein [Variovorax sp. YR216]|uniref:hypothetical protein n=1 Tax=Variovorax sp. YR216 TaxID=1882828 RepID=UPI000894A3F8|nr:hypothetical protein [Variovorax sp. YR216]SEB24130.1 hypothetical protein SAMN05444680_11991 [Variovorax sp. YR216]
MRLPAVLRGLGSGLGAPADKAYRQRLREWIELQWAEKDSLIPLLLKESPHVSGR